MLLFELDTFEIRVVPFDPVRIKRKGLSRSKQTLCNSNPFILNVKDIWKKSL